MAYAGREMAVERFWRKNRVIPADSLAQDFLLDAALRAKDLRKKMLKLNDLDFDYPNELVATEAKPRGESRILKIPRGSDNFEELTWPRFLAHFKPGDTLVLNNTQVLWARLIIEKESGKSGEVFFLRTLGSTKRWEVLTRALNIKKDKIIELPGGVKAKVLEAGRTSQIELQNVIDLKAYFDKYGQVPLPPYIVNLRGDAKSHDDDKTRYQNIWAEKWGSVAAPTAGLHFNAGHLEELKKNGVKIAYVTLQVGAGTFLPIETENLNDFKIHKEICEVSRETCETILKTQAAGKKVWACGTTVTRALETAWQAAGSQYGRVRLIQPFTGETELFIQPGYEFRVVNGMLTNFHQPRSSLLALVSAFASELTPHTHNEKMQALEKIKKAYKFAIEKKFRLFSYGDLTVIV